MIDKTEISFRVRLVALNGPENITDEDQREYIGDPMSFGPYPTATAVQLLLLLRAGRPNEKSRWIDVSMIPVLAAPAKLDGDSQE